MPALTACLTLPGSHFKVLSHAYTRVNVSNLLGTNMQAPVSCVAAGVAANRSIPQHNTQSYRATGKAATDCAGRAA